MNEPRTRHPQPTEEQQLISAIRGCAVAALLASDPKLTIQQAVEAFAVIEQGAAVLEPPASTLPPETLKKLTLPKILAKDLS